MNIMVTAADNRLHSLNDEASFGRTPSPLPPPEGTTGAVAEPSVTKTEECTPRKPRHQRRHSEDDQDDATTAYSSWLGDNSSQLSLTCLSSSHDDGEDCDGEDDGKGDSSRLSYPRIVVSSSEDDLEEQEDDRGGGGTLARDVSLVYSCSFYSAASCEEEEPPSPSSAVATELVERMREMLRRERSPDYEVDERCYLRDPAEGTTAGGWDGRRSPIDAECRAKMMEWSFRVLEVSFSPPPPGSTRRNSQQAIQIVSQAFALVDRLATRHFKLCGGRRRMDRSRYKLTCMVCLHIAAKTSGLFRLHDDEGGGEEKASRPWRDEDKEDGHLPRPAGSACSPSASQPARSPREEGQTILSTPPPSRRAEDGGAARRRRRSRASPRTVPEDGDGRNDVPTHVRPPLVFLSLPGLVALCRDEYTAGALAGAELDALEGLGWRVFGPTAPDWAGALLDLLESFHGGGGAMDVGGLRECALAGLERSMGEDTASTAPSRAALDTVMRALEEQRRRGWGFEEVVGQFNAAVRDVLPHR